MILKFYFEKNHPQKLGNFLKENNISRQSIAKTKHQQAMILVNHRRRLPTFLLKKGDVVHFIIQAEKENQYLRPVDRPINIIFENANYLVVDKPAGLLSIPSKFEMDSVVTRLMAYLNSENKDIHPHIVTRLDQDTSGLVLVAKTGVIHGAFANLAKEDFEKKYYALVHHPMQDHQWHEINAPIKKMNQSVVHVVDPTGKHATTLYQCEQNFKTGALVLLILKTGRTHQIRVHMQYLHHPLFGDKIYGVDDLAKRQMLHCTYLKFIDPITNQKKEFTSEIPQDMHQQIKELEVSNHEEKRRED